MYVYVAWIVLIIVVILSQRFEPYSDPPNAIIEPTTKPQSLPQPKPDVPVKPNSQSILKLISVQENVNSFWNNDNTLDAETKPTKSVGLLDRQFSQVNTSSISNDYSELRRELNKLKKEVDRLKANFE